jgi:putative phage-type endonuclease
MKLVSLNQGSDAWKLWRRGGLGGSDIAAVMGLSPYADHTRETVLAEKVRGAEREANFAMNRGTRLEPHARLAYERRQRCSAPPVCVEMAGCPWARVSLDGLCRAPADPAPWVLELKCPNWQTHDLALAGVVADHFAVQVQWQLLVCGLDRCDFASFNPSARFTPAGFGTFEAWAERHPDRRPEAPPEWLAVVPVGADPARQAEILEAASRFWYEVQESREQAALEAGVTP